MEQEKRPNVTAREQRWVGKWNEATGKFDLVAVVPEPEHPDHAVIRKHWESMGEL